MRKCRRGDVFQNDVTGERAIVLEGTEDSGDGRIVAYVGVRPGGAVAGEHVHPSLRERFRLVSGELCVKVNGAERLLRPGEEVTIEPGTPHDWWNAGDVEAQVVVEIDPGARFELLLTTTFGLAGDGLTNDKGMPHLLQRAVIADEFRDVIEFRSPPRFVQRLMLATLAPIGRALGYRAHYPRYTRPHGRVEVIPDLMAYVEPRAERAAA
jgi:mannose-6-phosphate isomerase-like protein (cupin superfamily)